MASKLTPFAVKYGLRPQDEDPEGLFWPHGKSGYTPTDPSQPLESTGNFAGREKIEKYQREQLLSGCTARELHDLGAFPDPTTVETSLSSQAILPIFAQERWETAQNLPPGKILLPLDLSEKYFSPIEPNTGMWTGNNPVVWAALKPVLQLASKVLTEIHTSSWIYAYLNGDFRLIPDNLDRRPQEQKDKNKNLWSFHAKDEGPVRERVHKANLLYRQTALLRVFEKRLTFAISSELLDARDNQTPDHRPYYGITLRTGKKLDEVTIAIANEHILPLLRNDLNPSELLQIRFNVAQTLLHEIAHGLRETLAEISPREWYNHFNEGYYENEIYSELGFSLESSVFGGPTMRNPDIAPHLVTFIITLPTIKVYTPPYLGGDKAIPQQRIITPMVSKYFEVINQDVFWDTNIRRYGLESLKAIEPSGFRVTLTRYPNGFETTTISRISADPLWILESKKASASQSAKTLNSASMSQKDLLAFIQQETDEKKAMAKKEQERFRKQRSTLAESILVCKDGIGSAAENERLSRNTIYMTMLEQEAELQSQGIVKFAKDLVITKAATSAVSDPSNEMHRLFLHRINRHLRELVEDLQHDSQKFADGALRSKIMSTTATLQACSLLLRVPDRISIPGFSDPTPEDIEDFINDPHKYLQGQNLKELMDSVIQGGFVDRQNLEREEASSVKEAEALVTNTAASSKDFLELGTRLFAIIESKPLTRAVGFTLQACNTENRSAEYHAKQAVDILRKVLANAQGDEQKEYAQQWLTTAEDVLKKSQAESRKRKFESLCQKKPKKRKLPSGSSSAQP